MINFFLLTSLLSIISETKPKVSPVATFSIIARDPDTGEIGVAVQSRIVAVGAVVPWAKAEVGAVATQSFANVNYGFEGLKLLKTGKKPKEVVKLLVEKDEKKHFRQVGVLSADGQSFHYTGKNCIDWAGGISKKDYSVQGNILESGDVLKAMSEKFETSYGKGPLGERLILALKAGQEAGGDKRGQQSAALLIVRKGWGYGGNNDKFRDLRVDEHLNPIDELKRVYLKHSELFPRPKKYVIKK